MPTHAPRWNQRLREQLPTYSFQSCADGVLSYTHNLTSCSWHTVRSNPELKCALGSAKYNLTCLLFAPIPTGMAATLLRMLGWRTPRCHGCNTIAHARMAHTTCYVPTIHLPRGTQELCQYRLCSPMHPQPLHKNTLHVGIPDMQKCHNMNTKGPLEAALETSPRTHRLSSCRCQ